jgi:hypothetical protein
MKKCLRFLFFPILILLMSFGTRVSTHSATASQRQLDPVCVAICTQLHSECFFRARDKGDERRYLGEYRHCIAHCK